jgi:hypothetical protein
MTPQPCEHCNGTGRVATAREMRLAAGVSPEDCDLVELGVKNVVSTGPVFHLTNGERLPMPSHDSIPAPPGLYWNDVYYWYVGKHLKEKQA